MRWPKYWHFSFSISPSNEHPGLICFRMDWLELLAVQGTLKSLLQHHSSKASIFRCSAFFTVQLSHPYMTTGKNITLTRQTFVGKVMFLLFNMLSRLVITFLKAAFSLHLILSQYWGSTFWTLCLISHEFNDFPLWLVETDTISDLYEFQRHFFLCFFCVPFLSWVTVSVLQYYLEISTGIFCDFCSRLLSFLCPTNSRSLVLPALSTLFFQLRDTSLSLLDSSSMCYILEILSSQLAVVL